MASLDRANLMAARRAMRPAAPSPRPDHFFRRYLQAWPIAHSLWRAYECERFAREELRPPVADLGCGDGFFAHVVYGRPLDIGVDFDEKEVSRAAARGAYRKALVADIRRLPLKGGSVNTIISNCVFEHIPDVGKALSEASRILRPGGRFLFTVPSEHFERHMLLPLLLKRLGLPGVGRAWFDALNRVFKHHHLVSADEWRRRLKKAGLRLERADPIIPRPVYHCWERWLLPALPSLLWKRLFGRWLLLPRVLAPWLASWWFRHELNLDPVDPEGPGYFLVARKTR